MTTEATRKPVMMVGLDEGEESFYAMEWALDHFFTPYAPSYPFSLLLVHAKPSPFSAIGYTGPEPATGGVISMVDQSLKKTASSVIDRATEICMYKSVNDVLSEVSEGDARQVLCEAVDKYHASILVVGSHGYGKIKRSILGSVSDYCAHHAHCSVMVVRKPKTKTKH
ncbi:hypothetical protein NMG60_11013837 [Bertholletia excelsa]